MEALYLLCHHFIIDELPDQESGTLTDLLVEPGHRYSMAGLLERPHPRLGMQVIRVHQRTVDVQNDYSRHEKLPSWLRIRLMEHSKVSQTDPGPKDLEGYTALLEGAAIVGRPERRIFRLAGKDPMGMLNAILTNDVPAQGDRGVYAMLLDRKGRVQTDLRVVRVEDEVLVNTEPEGAGAAEEILGRYAPFSRVKLEELPDWKVLGLYGPRATGLLGELDLAEHQTVRTEVGGVSVFVVGVAVPVDGYDLIGPADSLGTVREHLTRAGATPASTDAYETARIAAGIPRFGADVTPDNFPGESVNALERAVSFGKGCYPGQETVARMHYRGSPNKKLYRFELEPGSMEPPEAGDEILQGEKKLVRPISSANVVGWLTSVAPPQVDGKVYALGYLARKADLQAPMRAEDVKVLASKPA